jgi:hypothetical protein
MAIYDRQLGLDAALAARAATVFERELAGGQAKTRDELGRALGEAGIAAAGLRQTYLVMHAELETIICSGPRRGKLSTYALVAERAPHARRLDRDEALGELARRYFRSHGPATLRDFVWSGLLRDATRGLEMIRARAVALDGLRYWTLGASRARPCRGLVHLLPIYDEYLNAYRDRTVVPHGSAMVPSRAGGYRQFQHALVIGGQVAGAWRPLPKADRVEVSLTPRRRLTPHEQRAVDRQIGRYQRFLGT